MRKRTINKVLAPLLALLTLVVFSAANVRAAPGSLDPAFSDDGKLTDIIGRGNDVAIQADGKIIVAGQAGQMDFMVARYNPDGSPDIRFGIDGKVITQTNSHVSYANSVAMQADGKIVAAGFSFDFETHLVFMLARYNPDGSLDTTFDGDGIVHTRILSDDYAKDVAIQPDGKIVVGGCTSTAYDHPCDNFAIARYNPDGSLDTTFDSDGRVITPFGFLPIHEVSLNSITLQPDGKIMAAGYSYNGSSDDFTVARYNINGSLDTTFDFDGIVKTPIGVADDRAYSVALQPNGKFVVAGYSANGSNNDFAVVRYNTDGSLDTAFDMDGKVTTPMGSGEDAASAVAIQPDGKIVASGYSYGDSRDDFALARYNSDGSLDTTFGGGDGKTTVDFNNTIDRAYGMALDNRGRAVVVGESAERIAIARILLAPGAIGDFDGDGRSDISVFRPTDGFWFLDRSTAGFSAAQFGLATDKITPADHDGDGKTDISVYREGSWFWLASSDGEFHTSRFGLADDVPTAADYDGDGEADLSVFRPSNGTWYRQDSSNGQFTSIQFGQMADVPMPGDYDRDGKTDLAVFRPSNGYWYIRLSSDNQVRYDEFGGGGDIPVRGDFDGDGRSDLAVFRPSNGTWYIARPTGIPSQNFDAIQFGISTDIPVTADYDGDRKSDVAVYRDGTWYLRQSTSGSSIQQFGVASDKPVPAAYSP